MYLCMCIWSNGANWVAALAAWIRSNNSAEVRSVARQMFSGRIVVVGSSGAASVSDLWIFAMIWDLQVLMFRNFRSLSLFRIWQLSWLVVGAEQGQGESDAVRFIRLCWLRCFALCKLNRYFKFVTFAILLRYCARGACMLRLLSIGLLFSICCECCVIVIICFIVIICIIVI